MTFQNLPTEPTLQVISQMIFWTGSWTWMFGLKSTTRWEENIVVMWARSVQGPTLVGRMVQGHCQGPIRLIGLKTTSPHMGWARAAFWVQSLGIPGGHWFDSCTMRLIFCQYGYKSYHSFKATVFFQTPSKGKTKTEIDAMWLVDKHLSNFFMKGCQWFFLGRHRPQCYHEEDE